MEQEKQGLICKIGNKYYYGSINLTKAVKEIKQEARKELIKEFEKMIDRSDCDCEEFGNLKICGRCQIENKIQELKEKK